MVKHWESLWIALLASGLTNGAPLLQDFKILGANIQKRQSSSSCGFEGNSDFYGLGIRIGVYLQWITAFLANHLLQSAIETNLETNTIFLSALFIATVVSTLQDKVQPSELIVLLQLCFGFLFSILSIWGHRTARTGVNKDEKIRFPLMGSFFRLMLATSLAAYGLWFWFRGQDQHRQSGSCDDFTFLFARFNAAGNIRSFYQLQSSVILFFYGILFGRELLTLVCFFTFISIQSAVVAGLTLWFVNPAIGASGNDLKSSSPLLLEEDGEKREPARKWNLRSSFAQWSKLWFTMGWKEANGKESAGASRPDLGFYLIPLVNVIIFTSRTALLFWCLFFFRHGPSVDFIPMLQHPLSTQQDRKGAWSRMMDKIRRCYDSKYSLLFIYGMNLLCIIWTIIAVELTLLWNNINGVYSLNSTGQLIPLIIGVAGLLSFLHGMTVERSKLRSAKLSTDTIMALLQDRDTYLELDRKQEYVEDPAPVVIMTLSEVKACLGSGMLTKQISPSKSASLASGLLTKQISRSKNAVFWTRKPIQDDHKAQKEGNFYRRRHSIDIIQPHHIRADTHAGDQLYAADISSFRASPTTGSSSSSDASSRIQVGSQSSASSVTSIGSRRDRLVPQKSTLNVQSSASIVRSSASSVLSSASYDIIENYRTVNGNQVEVHREKNRATSRHVFWEIYKKNKVHAMAIFSVVIFILPFILCKKLCPQRFRFASKEWSKRLTRYFLARRKKEQEVDGTSTTFHRPRERKLHQPHRQEHWDRLSSKYEDTLQQKLTSRSLPLFIAAVANIADTIAKENNAHACVDFITGCTIFLEAARMGFPETGRAVSKGHNVITRHQALNDRWRRLLDGASWGQISKEIWMGLLRKWDPRDVEAESVECGGTTEMTATSRVSRASNLSDEDSYDSYFTHSDGEDDEAQEPWRRRASWDGRLGLSDESWLEYNIDPSSWTKHGSDASDRRG